MDVVERRLYATGYQLTIDDFLMNTNITPHTDSPLQITWNFTCLCSYKDKHLLGGRVRLNQY